MSIADELEKLAKLRDSGSVSNEEFENHKKALLSSPTSQASAIKNQKKISTYRKIRGVYLLALAAVNFIFFHGNNGMIALGAIFAAFGIYLLIKDNT